MEILITPFLISGKFGDVGDGEAETEGTKGVNKHGGIFAT